MIRVFGSVFSGLNVSLSDLRAFRMFYIKKEERKKEKIMMNMNQ